jgi:hypothetical protein
MIFIMRNDRYQVLILEFELFQFLRAERESVFISRPNPQITNDTTTARGTKYEKGFRIHSSVILLGNLWVLNTICLGDPKKRVATASISGTVAIIMKNGDVKPVAKTWFMVLPFSVYDLKLKHSPGLSETNMEKWLDEVESLYTQAEKEGKIFRFQTDFQGHYEVKGIPPSKYCISDDSLRVGPRNWTIISYNRKIGSCFIHWNYWIQFSAGQVLKLDFSNENATNILCF